MHLETQYSYRNIQNKILSTAQRDFTFEDNSLSSVTGCTTCIYGKVGNYLRIHHLERFACFFKLHDMTQHNMTQHDVK